MSRILCVIDGMTDNDFDVKQYKHLSSMRLSHWQDTCGASQPETLNCVLSLLGVKNAPQNLRGYVEALGAGIPVRPTDLIVRGSWFGLDDSGRCTQPCAAPAALADGRFRYYCLGGYKCLLIFPDMAHMLGKITTRLPSSSAGEKAGSFCPQGIALLAEVFNSLTAQDKCMAMWGQSAAVELPRFAQPAAVVCGKDIVKGIARLLGMDLVRPDGATGDVDTDLDAKTDAALSAAQRYPFVLLHINGADEAAHRRDAAQKNSFISRVDTQVLSRLLQSEHEIIVASDHGADPKNGCHIGTKQPIFVNTRG